DAGRCMVGCRRTSGVRAGECEDRCSGAWRAKTQAARRGLKRPMKIRLGVAPIAWTNNDLPQLGGETSLETCLKESREAGFAGTETGVKFPMDPKVPGPILARHRLALAS